MKRRYFIVLIGIFLIYSIISLYYASFVVHGVRYFTVSDDEMISMRYARNLVHGYGLVWNPGGQAVEGYSNLLWTLYMAFVHLFPIAQSKIGGYIQLSGALCLVGAFYFVKKIADLISNSSFFVGLVSVFFTAFYFPLFNWSVINGTEVGLLTLLTTWSTFLALRSVKEKKFSYSLLFLLGIGTLVRMDFVVCAVVILGYLIIFDKANRKRYLTVGVPIFFSFILIQTLWRLWYYNDILPNTYYDKLTGYPLLQRMIRGLYVTINAFLPTIISVNLLLFLGPFFYVYFSKNKQVLLLVTIFAVQCLYNIYAGGDVISWELYGGANRFVAATMPLFLIALVMSLYAVRGIIKNSFISNVKAYKPLWFACLIFLWLVLNRGSEHELSYLFLRQKPVTALDNPGRVLGAYCLNTETKPGAKIVLSGIGIMSYFTQNRVMIDSLGKTESTIAREPAKERPNYTSLLDKFTRFNPGHMKWDYPYIIKRYNPDVFSDVYQYWGYDYNDQYILQHEYIKMINLSVGCGSYITYVRKDSRYVVRSNLKLLSVIK